MPLSQRDFIEIIAKIEKEYLDLFKNGDHHTKKVGRIGVIITNKIKKEIKKRIIDNHGGS
tara:strand:- start:184 stop:363 length:180 start_codon:yes stop_codon:yes gene_type:complete